MPNKFNFIVFILTTLILLISCNQKNSSEVVESDLPESEVTISFPDGFIDYYDRFHTDSSFQMNHIVFPLRSKTVTIDSTGTESSEMVYTAENWKMHKPFQNDDSYTRTHQVIGNMVIEKIQDNMGLLEIERRWGVIDSTWNLIFYQTTEKQW